MHNIYQHFSFYNFRDPFWYHIMNIFLFWSFLLWSIFWKCVVIFHPVIFILIQLFHLTTCITLHPFHLYQHCYSSISATQVIILIFIQSFHLKFLSGFNTSFPFITDSQLEFILFSSTSLNPFTVYFTCIWLTVLYTYPLFFQEAMKLMFTVVNLCSPLNSES